MVRPMLLLALAAGFLGGCSHVPVMSVIRLARADLTNADPALLRAAVKLPRSLRLRRVVLRMGVAVGGGPEEAQEFTLREASDPSDVLALANELEGGTYILAYRLDPVEAARLAAFRDALKQKQQAGGTRGGRLTVAIRPDACRTAELPDRPVTFTAYLQTEKTGGYVPLARDVDLRTMSPGRDLAAEIPPCG